MRFTLFSVFIALLSGLISVPGFAAFQIPELCRAATIDFAKYEHDPLYPPVCVKEKNCGNDDAEAMADWFDAAAKRAADHLSSLPDYYPGNTQNQMCTELVALYTRVGQFKFVDLAKFTPARQQMIGEAVKFMAETTDRGYARLNLGRMERRNAAKADRPLLEARREAITEARERVKAEDAAVRAQAQAEAKARNDAERAAFEDEVTDTLFKGVQQGFTVSKGTGQTIYRPERGETFTDAVMYALDAWHEDAETRAKTNAFQPLAKDEFETTAQFEARTAAAKAAYDKAHKNSGADTSDLDDYVAAATGGFAARNMRYDADRQVFMADIVTSNGLPVQSVEIPVPLERARAEKALLEGADIMAAFTMDPKKQVLTLVRFGFVAQDKDTPANSRFYTADAKVQGFEMANARVASWRRLFEEKRRTIATQRAAEEEAERKRVAELYPYRARFTCSIGALYICLGRDGGISVRSGRESNYYSAQDVAGRDYLDVFLMHDFEIAAQTGSSAGRRMTLEINDYVTGKTLYREEAASPGGVIRVTD